MQGFSDECILTLVLGTHKIQATFLRLPIYPASMICSWNADGANHGIQRVIPIRGFFDFGA